MDGLVAIINSIDGFVWGPPMIIILLGTHLYLTVRTGGIQRKLFTAIKMSITKEDVGAKGDISQLERLFLLVDLEPSFGCGSLVFLELQLNIVKSTWL